MGNGYIHPHHLEHDDLQNFHLRRSSAFLPMLCSSRASIKDIYLPTTNKRQHRRSSSSTSPSSAAEPSSPKVSCIGQVKRNNRVLIGQFPAPYRYTTNAKPTSAVATTNIRYHKIMRRIFAGKNITDATTTYPTGQRELMMVESTGTGRPNHHCATVNVAELDPPLPVVKRAAGCGGRDEVNLWKRRSAGAAALKSLQLQQIHNMPNNNDHFTMQPNTVSTVC